MTRKDSSPPEPAYVKAMLDRFAEVLAQVMFGHYEVRATSDKDDAFADFALYINTLIAALQRRDKELRQYQHDLEGLVEHRTAELRRTKDEVEHKARQLQQTMAQLIQAEKLRALGEMTAGVAHEMNQPLNAVRLVCQDMLRDIERSRLDEETIAPNLQEIVALVDKMASIIDEMRLFTRRISDTPPTKCDANEAIDGVFRLLGQQLRDRGIEVDRQQDRSLSPVLANRVKLEQVIMNLITNARDSVEAFREQERRIEVACYGRSDDPLLGTAVVVEVRDNGRGLSAHDQQRAFEPFFTTKEPGEGTGLGLSVSAELVHGMGGRFEVESEVGQGARFRLILQIAP